MEQMTITAEQRIRRAAKQLAEARRALAYHDESTKREDRTAAITKLAQLQADLACVLDLLKA